MENYIIAAVLAVIIGFAVFYVVRAKKKGNKCIGCPEGGHCEKCKNKCGADKKY